MKLSTAFNPQTDGQDECTIQNLKDILRACVVDLKGNCDDHQPLIEFSYNNSYNLIFSISPFGTLYSMKCSSLFWWFGIGDSSLLGPEIIYEAFKKNGMIRDRLKTTCGKLNNYVDNRRIDLEF